MSAADAASRTGLDPLVYPLPGTARVAIVDAPRLADGRAGIFSGTDLPGLRQFAPQAIVLPLRTALDFAEQQSLGLLDLPSLTHAVIVLTTLDSEPIADHHANLLWRAFGLPLFEQLLGRDGFVIARECEVHDGLHLDARAIGGNACEELLADGQATGFCVEFLDAHCECGAETPRLQRISRKRSCAAAA